MSRRMKGGSMDSDTLYAYLMIGSIVIFVAAIMIKGAISKKEKFVPLTPSSSGDKREITPSGNVILY